MAEIFASELSSAAQFLLDAQNLVVFGQPLRTAWSASFDLQEEKQSITLNCINTAFHQKKFHLERQHNDSPPRHFTMKDRAA